MRTQFFRIFLLISGMFASSTAVAMIKASTEHPLLVAAGRLLIAALVLLPLYLRDLRAVRGSYGLRQLLWALPPAVLLGLHLASWVVGARLTQGATATLIVNLTTVVMPFWMWFLYRERISRRELSGTVLTLGGMLILTGSNLRFSPDYALGELISFGSMLALTGYLALARKNTSRLSLWLYMTPLYGMAGLICLAAAFFVTNPIKPYSLDNILYIVGLALVPTVLGHSFINQSMKYFRGQVVSVTNLSQVLFVGVQSYLFFGELPPTAFYPAAAVIVSGVLLVLTSRNLSAEPGVVRPLKPKNL
jgi:drug/metabolite transporter (DMT)-like permease